MTEIRPLVIGEQRIEPETELTVLDPATGEELARVAEANEAEVDLAVETARAALSEGPWGRMTADQHGRVLWRISELIEEHADELALLETADTGKPLKASSTIDVPQAATQFRYHAGWPTKLQGDVIPNSNPGHLSFTKRVPMGVVGSIVPWNFPIIMVGRKVAPALAAGNAVIFKPSEETPMSALRVQELAMEAGLPSGVFTVLPGRGEVTGSLLAGHPRVDMVAFTGGWEAAREVTRASASNFKRLHLELGGKSPNIVFEDADLSKAVPGALRAAFGNMGENCAAGSRLFVQDGIYEEFVARLAGATSEMKVGDGREPDAEVGPLISAGHRERVMGYVEAGAAEGARLVVGGRAVEGPGFFFQPTVFADVSDRMKIAAEEIFGPVLSVLRFTTEEEAVRRANNTQYGLAAAVWTENIGRAHRVADLLEAGTTWINCYSRFDVAVPFGGVKMSGHSRDHGSEGILEYTTVKTVWVEHGDVQ